MHRHFEPSRSAVDIVYIWPCYHQGTRWRSGGTSIPIAQMDRESGLIRHGLLAFELVFYSVSAPLSR